FHYPPFMRLIKITLKHKMPKTLNEGTQIFTRVLKGKLGSRVIGPAIPYVSRVRNQYLLDILIKMERKTDIMNLAKETIWEANREMHQTKGFSGVRVNVDVDPM
ncbi:MAG: primosomal protein N', partial [Bacteroidetes bacterium]|nr:primosomal protein N' [Bacteroidota bacterium]